MPWKNKEKKNEYNRKYRKEVKDFCREIGVCTTCNKNKAAPNHVQCADCLYKQTLYRMKYKPAKEKKEKYIRNKSEARKIQYEQRKEDGLCVRCGRKILDKRYVVCHICRNEMSKRKREQYAETHEMKSKYDRNACRICGKQVVQGKRYCKEHYQDKLNEMAYARQVKEELKAAGLYVEPFSKPYNPFLIKRWLEKKNGVCENDEKAKAGNQTVR